MWRHNSLTYSGKIILQIVAEIFYFPVWWYSVGFFRLLKGIWLFLRREETALGFSIWAKNIFVPMYGQADWAGRIISFLVRFVQVIVRGLILLIWLGLVFVVIFTWLLIPLFLLITLVFQVVK